MMGYESGYLQCWLALPVAGCFLSASEVIRHAGAIHIRLLLLLLLLLLLGRCAGLCLQAVR